MVNNNNVFANALLTKIQEPISSEQQAWRLLVDIGLLTVDLSNKVERLNETIYGNGNKGMRDQLDDLYQMMEKAQPALEHIRMRKVDFTKQSGETDWFRVFIRYFVDKILPALLISAIVSYVAFQFAVAIFLKSGAGP